MVTYHYRFVPFIDIVPDPNFCNHVRYSRDSCHDLSIQTHLENGLNGSFTFAEEWPP